MGPSGVGKDTLLDYLRRHRPPGVQVAHRYITRPVQNGPEAHIPLSEDEFLERRSLDLFALTWQAHGVWYGIGREVDMWLKKGSHVVLNGSREAFALVRDRFPGCMGILIQADPDVVRARLQARGREDAKEVARRLDRNTDLNLSDKNVMVIWNNDHPELSGAQLVQAIHQNIQATGVCTSP
ncbi:MAG: phosphonate metabolism protein/1,5-bisphosphokinase (PRPP-forming) PhnN [Desulfovermiculus sp.]|nr:phosphonate metabolism protein/1,5-bisphosphokinase (PRPP-forming) PhnN [Desulfovermiculus sp.]